MTLVTIYNPLLKKSFQAVNDTSEFETIFSESREFTIKKFKADNQVNINKFWDFGLASNQGYNSINYKNFLFRIEKNGVILYNDLFQDEILTPFEMLSGFCKPYFESGNPLTITVYYKITNKKITTIEPLNESFKNLFYFPNTVSVERTYRERKFYLSSAWSNLMSDFQNWNSVGFPIIDTRIVWFTNRNEINIPFKHGASFFFTTKRKNVVRVYDSSLGKFVTTEKIFSGNHFTATCTKTMLYAVNNTFGSFSCLNTFNTNVKGYSKQSLLRVYEFNFKNYYFYVIKPLGHDFFKVQYFPTEFKLYGYFYQDGNSTPFVRELDFCFRPQREDLNSSYMIKKQDILRTGFLINSRFNPNYHGKSSNFNKKMKVFYLDNKGNGSELSDLYIDVETLKMGYTIGLKLKTE
jgi:hypothetical protein